MAYSTANLHLEANTIGGDDRLWSYRSADTYATVAGSGYFSDGVARGMLAKDIILVIDTAGVHTWAYVSTVGATAITVTAISTTATTGTFTTVTTATANVTGALNVTGTANIASTASKLVGFYGATAVSQRTSSNQATTNIAASASFGATQLAVIQEIMNTLAGLGLWKGS